jgi:hypothetical protein
MPAGGQTNPAHRQPDVGAAGPLGGIAGAWQRAKGDIVCLVALAACCIWVFGERSELLGLYSDDAGFIANFEPVSFSRMLYLATHYIPGRNFHYFWEYLVLLVSGSTLDSLPTQHVIETGLIALNAGALYLALRLMSLPPFPCFVGASLFAFYPGRAEALYWLQAIPMNLVSTLLIFMIVILGIVAVRAARSALHGRAALCLLGQSVLFAPALLSYDQSDIVVVIATTGSALACALLMRSWRAGMVALAGLYSALFLGLMVVKFLYPADGPTFGVLTLAHLASNYSASFSNNFGAGLDERMFSRLLPHTGLFEREIAFAVAAGILAAGLLCGAPAVATIDSSARGSKLQSALRSAGLALAVMLAGVAFYFAAYLPACAWYVSPRHDYLPSAGIAIFAAGATYLITASGSWLNREVGLATRALILGGLAAFLYLSVQCVLIEKGGWIASYQARKNLYAELVRDPKFRAASTLVLDGFPSLMPFTSAPLGYQQAAEASLMTRGVASMRDVVQSAAPARQGEFIYLEGGQWGEDSFLYVLESRIYHIYFRGLRGDHVEYSTHAAGPEAAPPFAVEDAGAGGEATAPGDMRQVVDVSLPMMELGDDEALALRPLIAKGDALVPLQMPNSQGVECEVLIDVSRPAADAPHEVRISFDAAAVPRIRGVELWLVDELGRRMIRRDLLQR